MTLTTIVTGIHADRQTFQEGGARHSLRTAAIAGSLWVIGGYGAVQVLRLAGNLILAWLLFPAAFGLIAIVNVVIHGLTMFSDLGIGQSIIQNRKGATDNFLNTAWSIQIVRGIFLWIAACLLAWPMAWFFARNDPFAWQLATLLPVAGLTALIAGFNSTRLFTLNRDLRLRRLTAIDVCSHVLGVISMIGWALFVDRSVWALVVGGLAGAAVKMALSHLWIDGPRVRPAWNWECFWELFHFGKWIFLSTAFAFTALHFDKLVLGALLTLGELGIYAITFAFAKAAMHVCTKLSDTVLFPVYSKFRDDPSHMVRVALRAREVVLYGGAAVCLCFAIGAPIFFETLYDPRYAAAGTIAQWLALYMWATILLLSMNRLPLAMGNSRALFLSNLFRCSGIGFAIGGYWLAGLPGFIAGLALGPALTHLLLLVYIPNRRSRIVLQSMWFTLPALLYGVVAIIVSQLAQQSENFLLWGGTVAALTGVPAAVCGWLILKRIRQRDEGPLSVDSLTEQTTDDEWNADQHR